MEKTATPKAKSNELNNADVVIGKDATISQPAVLSRRRPLVLHR